MRKKLSLSQLNRISVEEYRKIEKLPIIIVTDNIRSALNIGSIFRTADSFAIDKIYICGISAHPPHKEITKTAIGATSSVAWQYFTKVSEAIDDLQSKGYKIIAVEQTDDSISLTEYKVEDKKIALLFGNEVAGVGQEIIDRADLCLEIKQYGTKHSLNVSVCAGIVIHYISNLWRTK